MSYTTADEQRRAERRADQRELMRGVQGPPRPSIENAARDALVEDILRQAADEQLGQGNLRRHLEDRAAQDLHEAARRLLNEAFPKTDAAKKALESKPPQAPDLDDDGATALSAFIALATVADLVADDGYRDPRVDDGTGR